MHMEKYLHQQKYSKSIWLESNLSEDFTEKLIVYIPFFAAEINGF